MFSTNISSSPSQFTMVTSSFTNENCSSLSRYLKPHFADHDMFLGELMSSHHQPQPPPPPLTQIPSSSSKNLKASNPGAAKKVVRQKRTGKKDRHSKIYTAQGPRDRRMRLSLHIARKFFDLQDMLGFDKASKTIEWLFSKSMAAIEELADSFSRANKSTTHSGSSNSDSEVVSGSILRPETQKQEAVVSKAKKSKKQQKLPALSSVVARESRDKARARARERTKEKNVESEGLHNCANSGLVLESEETIDQSVIDTFVGIENYEPRSSSFLDFSHDHSGPDFVNDILGFNGNWETYNAGFHIMDGTNIVQVEDPIFMDQEAQNPSSIFIDVQEQNPNLFMNVSNSSVMQNPTSFDPIHFMNAHLSSGNYQLPTSLVDHVDEPIF